MSRLSSEGELENEGELEKILKRLGVDYFYYSEAHELLIKGELVAYQDDYFRINYDEYGYHYSLTIYQNPDSVTLDIVSPFIREEIVIPVPPEKIWYAKPYIRIRFPTRP